MWDDEEALNKYPTTWEMILIWIVFFVVLFLFGNLVEWVVPATIISNGAGS